MVASKRQGKQPVAGGKSDGQQSQATAALAKEIAAALHRNMSWQSDVGHRPVWQCASCGKRNLMDRSHCRKCKKQFQAAEGNVMGIVPAGAAHAWAGGGWQQSGEGQQAQQSQQAQQGAAVAQGAQVWAGSGSVELPTAVQPCAAGPAPAALRSAPPALPAFSFHSPAEVPGSDAWQRTSGFPLS